MFVLDRKKGRVFLKYFFISLFVFHASSAYSQNTFQPAVVDKLNLKAKIKGKISWSSDSKHLLIPVDNHMVIAEASTGNVVSRIQGHKSEVLGSGFANNNRLVYSWAENDAKVWNSVTGRLINSFQSPTYIHQFGVSPDGKMIGISDNNSFKVLRASDQKQVYSANVSGSAFSFSPDAKNVVFYTDKCLKSVSLDGKGQENCLTKAYISDKKPQYNINGRSLLFYAGDRGKVHELDINTKKLKQVFTIPDDAFSIQSFHISGDGKMIIINAVSVGTGDLLTGKDDHVFAFNRKNGKLLKSWKSYHYGVPSPDNAHLILTSRLAKSILIDKNSFKMQKEIDKLPISHADSVRSLAYADPYLVAQVDDHRVTTMNLGVSPKKGYQLTSQCNIFSVAAQRNMAAYGDSCGRVRMWNIKTGKTIKTWSSDRPVRWIEFSSDGSEISVQGYGFLKTYNTKNFKTTYSGESINESSSFVRYDALGKKLAVSGSITSGKFSNSIDILNSKNKKGKTQIKSETDWIAMSHDGKSVASIGRYDFDTTGTQELRVFRSDTGALIWKVKLNFNHGGVVEFSPNGKFLASGGPNGVVNLWDAKTGKKLHVLKDFSGEIKSLVFTSNGKKLIIGTGKAPHGNTVTIFGLDGPN